MEATDTGLLILRVVFGVFLALHGINKVRGLAGTARWFGSIGMRWPRLQAALAAGTEIGAGLLLALGALTPLAAAAIIGVMTVAGWVDHRPHGFFIFNNGWEYVAAVAAAALSIAVAGPGRYSIDHALDRSWSGLAVGLGALVVGVGTAVAQLGIAYRPATPGEER